MTGARLVRLARGAAVAALLALLAAPAAAATTWRISSLGAPGGVVLMGREAERSFHYRLPAGAAQGRPLWYLMHLRARVVFRPGPGEYVLSADSNGLTAAQIIFRVRRDSVTTDSLGLADGHRLVTTPGHTAFVDFSNYEQYHAVLPGANTLRFQFETLAGPGARSVAIAPDSGIATTRVRPDELRFLTPLAPIVASVGDDVEVPYRLERRGGRADGPVRVWFSFDGAGLERRGAVDRAYPRLGRGRTGFFVVHATAPGTFLAHVSVPQRLNQPSRPITITVVDPASARLNLGLSTLIGGVLLLGGALAVAAGVRSRRSLRVPADA